MSAAPPALRLRQSQRYKDFYLSMDFEAEIILFSKNETLLNPQTGGNCLKIQVSAHLRFFISLDYSILYFNNSNLTDVKFC